MVAVTLTPSNLTNIRRHKPFQLANHQLHGGSHELHLKPGKARRIETAIRRNRGIRLHLEPSEMQGLGLMDVVRRGYNARVKPLVRPALHRAVDRLAPAIQRHIQTRAQPVIGKRAARNLSSGTRQAIDFGIDKVGDLSGAYGIKDDFKRFHRRAKPVIRRVLQRVVKGGLRTAAALAGPAAPLANELIDRYSDKAVGAVGDLTGGFGQAPKHARHMRGGSFKAAGY